MILGVDTSTAFESVALLDDGVLRGEVRFFVDSTHSQHLVPAIDFMLTRLGRPASAIDAFAVTTGPGSFTGLRVGLSTVQGLALASGKLCMGISTLEVLARRIAGTAPHHVSFMNAYRGEVFGAIYDATGRLQGEPVVAAPEEFLRGVPAESAFIGDAVALYSDTIRRLCPRAVFPPRSLFLAETLVRLSALRLADGEGVPPERLRPVYLREAAVRKAF